MKKSKLMPYSIIFLLSLTACAINSSSEEKNSNISEENPSSSFFTSSSDVNSATSSNPVITSSEELITSFSTTEISMDIPVDNDGIPEGATQITGKITITEPGNYYVNTTISEKKITVDCEGVHLYLQDANLSNEKKVIESNYALTITLIGENTITNSNVDGSNAVDCVGDLIINGSGTLHITSTKNGIKANSITVIDASLVIDASKDGLHAEIDAYDSLLEEPVPSYDDGGFVYLKDANISINSEDDGVQADTYIYIMDGTALNINTKISETSTGKGIKAGALDWGADATELEWDGYLICIKGGIINIDAIDDAIHSNGNIEITGGEITISSGDDGIHADGNLLCTDGKIVINESYEGLEGTSIDIAGGEIYVTSSDDGVNAAGGADSSGFGGNDGGGWGKPGPRSSGSESLSETPYVNIVGGKLVIDSITDGIDANGNLTIGGGEIYISGPTSGADNALDADNSVVFTGGRIIAVSKYGMKQSISSSSTQCNLSLNTSSLASGKVSISDNNGNELLSYTPTKNYNSIIISCPELTKGETYQVSACNKNFSVMVNSTNYNGSF